MGKISQFACKIKLYIKNNVIFSQNGILFSNDTIIWIDIYKNQLKTDVLNVKHYVSVHSRAMNYRILKDCVPFLHETCV